MNLLKREPIIEYDDFDLLDEKILKIRGIPMDLKYDFIQPKEKYLNDPYLLDNMDKAVDIVGDAIGKNKKIGVYSDIDPDGVTSTQIMYGYLKIFTENVEYIMSQRIEGHGVNPLKVNDDIELLIVVDSSTNSVQECKVLKERGVEILIFDHHEKEIDNPHATIINPHICNYPNKHLSGAGVVWQFTRAFDSFNGIQFANDFIDLAAVGMVADMMDMKNMENRYIVWAGLLSVHNRMGNLGLYNLFKELGKQYKPTSLDISFYVAPCLSAIIRLDDINILMELFNSDDEEVCKLISKEIKSKNEERKELTDGIYKSLEGNLNDDKVIIIDMTESQYKSAMFGLIANKVARENQKPCLVGRIDGDEFKGSGRGFGDEIKLKDELSASGLFTLVAGHQNSFGVKFKIENLDKIKSYVNKKFNDYFNEKFAVYDLEIRYEDMTEANLRLIDDISFVCGEGFSPPTFLIKYLVPDEYKKIGKKENHTKLTVRGERNLDIMKFNTEEKLDDYINADYIDVVGNIGINEFYNFGLKQVVVSKQILSDIIVCREIDI